MCQEICPTVPSDIHDRISVLAVAPAERVAELERIVAHTRWRMHVVHNVREAIEAVKSLCASVVLCEHRLPDGTWLDVMHAAQQTEPRPEVIVISPSGDLKLWEEVLHCGGYDLLTTPLEPRVIYETVPMAWRQSNGFPPITISATR